MYVTRTRKPKLAWGILTSFILFHFPGTKKSLSLTGDLTQVNIWDTYPIFRIQRISTNSACGGGNVVQWKDFLNAISVRDVQLYSCDDCPKRVGFKFDKKKQNNLV